MSGLNTSVRLTLKDAFSKAMPKVSKSVDAFGKNISKVSSAANKALSGVAGSFASLGLAIGAAAAIKETIEFEDRLVRMGTIAGATSAEIKKLKDNVFAAATLPDIKVNEGEIVSAQEVILTKTGNWDFVNENIENIGRAIQGMDASGADVGGMMAEFDKLGYSAREVTTLLDAMYVQGNMGAFTAAEFAKNGSAIISAYSSIGTTSKDIEKANAVMQILTKSTGDPTAAVTVLENVMSELADPSKQEALKKMGIHVRDIETGQFRDLTELLPEIVEKGKELGNLDSFGTIFGGTAMQGLRAFDLYGDSLNDFLDLGDTANALSEASAKNAATLASNLENLKTLFMSVANTGLEKPLQKINDLLNEMSKHPWAIKAVFGALVAGIGLVAAASGISTVLGIVNGFASWKNRKTLPMPSGGGGTGMPVFVTNMGGSGLGMGANGQGSSNKKKTRGKKGYINQKNSPASNNPRTPKTPAVKAPAVPSVKTPAIQKPGTPSGSKTSTTSAGGSAAIVAIMAALQLRSDLDAIENTEGLTQKEAGKAKGEVTGGAIANVASVGIVAAAMAKGAALGTLIPIPVVGTILGGVVGTFAGLFAAHLANKAGQGLGGMVGERLAESPIAGTNIPREYIERVERYSIPGKSYERQQPSALAEINQTAAQPHLTMDVTITDKTTTVTSDYGNNHVSRSYPKGSAQMARNTM